MKKILPPVRFSGVSTGIELVLEVKGYDADDIDTQLKEIGKMLDNNPRVHKCTVKGVIQ